MKQRNTRKLMPVMLIVLTLAFAVIGSAQYGSGTKTQTSSAAQGTPTLTARLVDAEKKAQQKAATVDVKVTGIKIVDPAEANEKPVAGTSALSGRRWASHCNYDDETELSRIDARRAQDRRHARGQ